MPAMMPAKMPVQQKPEREASRERKAMWASLKKSAKGIPTLRDFIDAHGE